MRARIVRFPITIILPVLRRHERAAPVFRNSVSPRCIYDRSPHNLMVLTSIFSAIDRFIAFC